MRKKTQEHSAFTLIELLIVVLIIAILAAIAVPNFLEFQTRAKVSRAMSDMRTISTALEAYAVDNSDYPINRLRYEHGDIYGGPGGINMVIDLTTPIAYLSTVDLADPFINGERDHLGWVDQGYPFSYMYVQMDFVRPEYGWTAYSAHWSKWMLMSYGPNRQKGPDPTGNKSPWLTAYYGAAHLDPDSHFNAWDYDPTNGTVSNGDITRWQAQ